MINKTTAELIKHRSDVFAGFRAEDFQNPVTGMSIITEKGLDREYVSLRLNASFETLAKQAVKEGIKIDGLEVRETEYISIAQPKADKEEHRKVVTE